MHGDVAEVSLIIAKHESQMCRHCIFEAKQGQSGENFQNIFIVWKSQPRILRIPTRKS